MKLPFNFSYLVNTKRDPIIHRHSSHEIYYFYEGDCNFLVGNSWIPMRSGDLLIMHGMSKHGPMMNNACLRTVIHFENAYHHPLLPLLRSVDLLQPFKVLRNYHWHLTGNLRSEAEDILDKIHRYYRQPGMLNISRQWHHFQELLLFIYDCSHKLIGVQGTVSENKERNLLNILTYLEQNFMHEVTLDSLSEHVHLSKFYLSRIFKELTGMTVFEYLNKLRINQARILLLEGKNRNITDICYDVGFKHLPHFSSSFKQMVGMSPIKYREMLEAFMRAT